MKFQILTFSTAAKTAPSSLKTHISRPALPPARDSSFRTRHKPFPKPSASPLLSGGISCQPPHDLLQPPQQLKTRP
ncbi:hypothetical protein QQF64_028052 [Cirrhinus molitorella]|uniref:Uncharacterized protein n=1 Tax=Cirrhinus molitorella TaxID=172907 RepID=A0ABR3N5I1_9TELE